MQIRWIVSALLISLSAGLAQAMAHLPQNGVAVIIIGIAIPVVNAASTLLKSPLTPQTPGEAVDKAIAADPPVVKK